MMLLERRYQEFANASDYSPDFPEDIAAWQQVYFRLGRPDLEVRSTP
jgi:hypothetical protein